MADIRLYHAQNAHALKAEAAKESPGATTTVIGSTTSARKNQARTYKFYGQVLSLHHHGFDSSGDSGSGCLDDKESCGDWAEIGYCNHSYVDYMRVHCSESCDLCRK